MQNMFTCSKFTHATLTIDTVYTSLWDFFFHSLSSIICSSFIEEHLFSIIADLEHNNYTCTHKLNEINISFEIVWEGGGK